MRRRWNWGSGGEGDQGSNHLQGRTRRVGPCGRRLRRRVASQPMQPSSPRHRSARPTSRRRGGPPPPMRPWRSLSRSRPKLSDAWLGNNSRGQTQTCSNSPTTTRPRRLARFGCFFMINIDRWARSTTWKTRTATGHWSGFVKTSISITSAMWGVGFSFHAFIFRS
jgi:hypothetical protein